MPSATKYTLTDRNFVCSCGFKITYEGRDKNNKKFNLLKRLHYKKCDGSLLTDLNQGFRNHKIKARSKKDFDKYTENEKKIESVCSYVKLESKLKKIESLLTE